MRKTLLSLMLLLASMAPASAGLLDIFDNRAVAQGYVMGIQSNHFFVTDGTTKVIRIDIKPGQLVPQVISGTLVEVKLLPGPNDTWILDEIKSLTPGVVIPAIVPANGTPAR